MHIVAWWGTKLAVSFIVKLFVISGICIAVIGVFAWEHMKSWFESRRALYESDRDNIAFSFQEKFRNNTFRTVLGIYNTRTNELVDAQAFASKSVDEKVRELHAQDKLVIVGEQH
jgi:hypothetical protein